MKKLLIIIVVLAASLAANAQDHIIFRDGSDVSARVTEVTPQTVKYKKMSNPNGPLYTSYTTDIEKIVYENGTEESFGGHAAAKPEPPRGEARPEPIEKPEAGSAQEHPGMSPYDVRYKDIRRYYEGQTYHAEYDDPYSPFASGLASFFIPGLGQCINGEVGRGIGIVAGNLGFVALEVLEVSAFGFSAADLSNLNYYNWGYNGTVMFMSGVALLATATAQCAFNIWNIFDAARIAEVKNMYYQDVVGRPVALDMHFTPQLAFTPTAGNVMQPTAGVAFRINF